MGLAETWDYYWTEMADERTNGWPLLGSPFTVPAILFSYLYFVLKCGPRFMENRKPYSLKTFIKFYNVFQIVANALAVYKLIDGGCFTEMGIGCEPVRYTYERGPMMIASTIWWVLLIKLLDLVETGVFVLRKKDRQVSTLHLYHHVSTVFIQWLGAKYVAGGMAAYPLLLNCAVHVIMYTYYFLSSWGPGLCAAISGFKPMITIIQMVQFVIIILFALQAQLPSCPVPKFPGVLFNINVLINFYMFYDFYRKTYTKQDRKKA